MPDDPGRDARYATVYRRGRTYVVTATRGSYRSPPYFVLDIAAADATVGQAVREAVAGYRSHDEEPADSEIREADAQLFALVGVKDETTFARRASLVEIVERGDAYVVEPWGRDRSGWYPLKEATHIHLRAPSEDTLGAAVRRAFGRPAAQA